MTTKFRPLDREEFMERASYDLERAKERSMNKVKKETQSLADRAALYNRLRAEGANPDEAAQGAGWKNFASAQVSCNQGGIKISAKGRLTDAAPPREAPVIIQDIKTEIPQPRKPEPVVITELVITPEPANENPVLANEPALPANESFPAPTLIPDRMEPVLEPDKPRTLCPCRWYGKDCTYTDIGDYIDIKPREGAAFQLTRESLKQFSEEINELLEIIK